jgi:hypothetical protein
MPDGSIGISGNNARTIEPAAANDNDFAHNRPGRHLKFRRTPYRRPHLQTRKEGGKAPKCSLSLARLITAKLDARRDAGETLDKIASLHGLVKAFASPIEII